MAIRLYLTELQKHLFFKFLFYNSFRFPEKLQRQYTEFPYTAHIYGIKSLYWYGIFITINEPKLIYYN